MDSITNHHGQEPPAGHQYVIQFNDVLEAVKQIEGIAYETPVLTSTSLDNLSSNHKLFFKVEALQRTGSFKFRGALNAILHLLKNGSENDLLKNGSEDDLLKNGSGDDLHVVTHSSGNHAAAVACAAKIAENSIRSQSLDSKRISATIVMPENAPIIKVNGVRGFGGNIVFCESTNQARKSTAEKIVQEQKAEFIHPSENKRVIAGQGTVCIEFLQQVRELTSGGNLDVVIIPVGGGGLGAGNTIALRGMLGEKVKIVLAEPEELDDAKRSKEAGQLLGHRPDNKLKSVADGLKTTLGPNTWPIIRDLVDDIITVSEKDILWATKIIWERLKICIEPSAGVGVAVALSREFAEKYKVEDGFVNVGIILCGGNADVIKVAKLMEEHGL